MPIYEYKCNACGHIFEQLVLGADRETVHHCPSCGDKDTFRVLSSFSSSLSGSDGSLGGLSSSCGPKGGFS